MQSVCVCLPLQNFTHYLIKGPPKVPLPWLSGGLCGRRIPEAILTIAMLLKGPAMPDKSRVLIRTKRDNLRLYVGDWA